MKRIRNKCRNRLNLQKPSLCCFAEGKYNCIPCEAGLLGDETVLLISKDEILLFVHALNSCLLLRVLWQSGNNIVHYESAQTYLQLIFLQHR